MTIDLLVKCDPDRCWTENRNGIADLTAMHLWQSVDERTVFLNGMGVRGGDLRRGFCITVTEMDELAERWLQARNPRRAGADREEQQQ